MNILILTGELNQADGVSNYIYNFVNGLAKEDARIHILCPGGNAVDKFKNTQAKIIIDKNLNHSLRSVRSFSLAIKNLISVIKSNKMDILHSHNHYCANIAHYAAKLTGKKTIQTIHGMIPEIGKLKHFRAEKYVSVNETAINYILKNKIAKNENVRLIRPGIQFKNFTKSQHASVNILCASRLVPEKGVDVFVRAAEIVKKQFGNSVKFSVAGNGECLEDLKILNSGSGVEFLGTVSNMESLLSSSDIVVVPTKYKTEGFPIIIPEAASKKNLIISSEFDSLKYVFEKGKDGLTFETGNHNELADKITFAIQDREKTNQMIENFYNKSKKLFDIEEMVEKHLKLYNECLTH